ncbi:MAG TPA: extracellular solute-binding protein, partial [Chloroflexota bacterium]|nr:extracellular solute-binding protein [Chloroflexota bacterium]
ASGAKVLHIPTVFGSVVLAYNLPDVKELKLDSDTLASIYLGEITKWNDPKIAALNSGVTLPDKPIQVVHRSDSSGTTNIFTSYLAGVSPTWSSKVGKGKETMTEPDKKHILLVEDDRTISDLLAYNLRHEGYDVAQEYNGRAGLETALRQPVDLVLMDIMLPGLDGLAASREIIRRKPNLPIIMLTARSDRETVLEGFGLGADDYITKPFDLDVLLARIQARLRRAPSGAVVRAVAGPATGAVGPSRSVTVADLVLDRDAHTIRGPKGEMGLNPKEYDLLELLLSRPGHLFQRDEIIERVWHHQYAPASRSLDVHIRRLRAKLESIDAGVELQTVRGVGHRVVPGAVVRQNAEDGS